MASLSLPRVFQIKKNSLDAEREQFEKFQTLAIQKAINTIETPVKEKHVRSTIIGTFQEQSAVTYWMVAVRLPLQENRIAAWKFCHVTHKLLREGHPACLDDSQRHIAMIENLAKLWVHLREGYGKLVNLYCTLLVCKLRFHARNPRFPGNMQLTADELDAIAENDVNNYFQLCVELFDYLDDILNLQAAVFDSLGNARANSMTASGQCRLAALIPCAQDSSQIYDCNVRLLFRLHAALPPDTLTGHRERFRQQFKKLSSFYKHASSLQYYRNLLSLPLLPSNPPNFLIQSDFGTYVTPVVSIPEAPPDDTDAVGALIDTSDTYSQFTQSTPEQLDVVDSRTTPSPQLEQAVEQDRHIENLAGELRRTRESHQMEMQHLVQERNSMLESMRDHCTQLESQLQFLQRELELERKKTEVLAAQTPEMTKKLTEVEDKARVTDEKFQKLKGAYTQLREEHITLIRQKAEVDKAAMNLRAAAAQHESAKALLLQQLNDKVKDVELLQQSASSSEQVEAYKSEITNLRSELEQAMQKETEFEALRASMAALEIENRTSSTEAEEKINTLSSEIKDLRETLEQLKKDKEEKENELSKVKEELIDLRETSEEDYKRVIHEKETVLQQIIVLTEQHNQEKQDRNEYINTLKSDLEKLENKLSNIEKYSEVETKKLIDEVTYKSTEFDSVIQQKDSEIDGIKQHLLQSQEQYNREKALLEEELQSRNKELGAMLEEIHTLKEYKDKFESNNSEIGKKLESESREKIELQKLLTQKSEKILMLEDKIKILMLDLEESASISQKQNDENKILTQLEEKNNEKDIEIKSLKEKCQKLIESNEKLNNEYKEQSMKYEFEMKSANEKMISLCEGKDVVISNLKSMLKEKDEIQIALNVEVKKLSEDVTKLKEELEEKSAELEIANNELFDLTNEYDSHEKRNDDNLYLKNQDLRELNDKIKILTEENAANEKMISLCEGKDVVISNLKSMLKEKDEIQIALNVEVKKLSEDVTKLKEELEEKSAELEIANNELFDLTNEYDSHEKRNDDNLYLKNQDLRELNDKVKILTEENATLLSEKATILKERIEEKEELNKEMEKLKDEILISKMRYEALQKDKEEISSTLSSEIEMLNAKLEEIENDKELEIQNLKSLIENDYKENIRQKDNRIKEFETKLQNLESLDEAIHSKEERIDELVANIAQKEEQSKILEERIERGVKERLRVECELQDLLQHNASLEEALAVAKKQLEESQVELAKRRSDVVSGASSVATEMVNNALAALERSAAHESGREAGDLAAAELAVLATLTEVSGKEQQASRAAMLAAHGSAQLSAYVTDVANVATDGELAEKLTNECRAMLTTTKQCVESLGQAERSWADAAGEAAALVRAVAGAAAAADRQAHAVRSVDDELADMDTAIEDAANRIEEMLVASRAADTGAKLEVNGAILDACTGLMGAVRALVREARALQAELGDPATRRRVYRKNPQWAQGLVSAAKAVVFAAKLLVSSADEAVGAAGRVEGVSAAAHEVAGSTAQLVAASRARAPPAAPALARLTTASRAVAAATGAVVAAVRTASALQNEQEALDTSSLTLTATRILEMESRVRALELETALEAERVKLAALRKRHYHLAQAEENGNMTNGQE